MKRVALRRLFDVINGGTPTSEPENWDGDVPWATPVDLGRVNGGRLGETLRTLTDEGLKSGSSLVPAGSLVVSTRAPIGYVAETKTAMAFNQGCRGLSPRAELDVRYFRYQLSASTEQLQALGQGSTFVELSTDSLRSFLLAAPSAPSQRAIADYLDAETARIDSLVDARRHQLRVLPERLAALVAKLVSQIPREPLGHCLASVEQGWSPTADEAVRDSDDQWAVLKLSAVTGGTFRPNEHKSLPSSPGAYSRYEVRAGDLLMTRANTPELVGDVVFVDSTPSRLLIPDLVYRLRYSPQRASGRYLGYVLRTDEVRGQLAATARGTSQSMVKIRGADIREIQIPLPDVHARTRIAEILASANSATRDLTDSLVRQIGLLSERRQALITQAVTGQLDIRGVAA